ncbi:hypothetical protein ACFPLB_09040 [Aquamicrobium segne]|uniref:Uncharacterized protein n=1 Tax=Aquamicrobium segne TaxID=469547 RepID=A0ABW0GX54_9HYPH
MAARKSVAATHYFLRTRAQKAAISRPTTSKRLRNACSCILHSDLQEDRQGNLLVFDQKRQGGMSRPVLDLINEGKSLAQAFNVTIIVEVDIV